MAREPSPPLTTISEALELASAHLLRPMLGLLPNAPPPPRRKADMMAATEERLCGDSLRELWDGLDETQQLVVREALDSPYGFFDRHYFEMKYGRVPAGFEDDGGLSTATLLHCFLYAPRRHGAAPTIVPLELGNRLRAFVPPPPAAEVPASDELPEGVPLTRRDMERPGQHDLLAVLRLVEAGRVAVSASTRRPGAAACRLVAEALADGDFYDATAPRAAAWVREIGPIRAFAWPWLMQAAKLAELRGSKLALTKSGRAALHAPAAPTLRAIWKRWLGNTLLDEFNRVDAIKGQNRGAGRRTMTRPSGRRSTVADALKACPLDRWVRFDDFGRFMQVGGFDLVVNRDPWKPVHRRTKVRQPGLRRQPRVARHRGPVRPLPVVRVRRHPGPDRRRLHRTPRRATRLHAHVGL